MALALTTATATAGTDFSTIVTGFTADMLYRALVNNAGGRYQLAQVDDTTMRLTARGDALQGGRVDRVVIETATGLTSDSRTRETLLVTVAFAGAPAPQPTIVVPPQDLDAAVSFTPTVSAMPAGAWYELRDARSQGRLRPSDIGLSLDTSTGAMSGQMAAGNGFGRVYLAAMLPGGRMVARSNEFVLLNTMAYNSVPLSALTFSDNQPLQFSDGQYLELAA